MHEQCDVTKWPSQATPARLHRTALPGYPATVCAGAVLSLLWLTAIRTAVNHNTCEQLLHWHPSAQYICKYIPTSTHTISSCSVAELMTYVHVSHLTSVPTVTTPGPPVHSPWLQWWLVFPLRGKHFGIKLTVPSYLALPQDVLQETISAISWSKLFESPKVNVKISCSAVTQVLWAVERRVILCWSKETHQRSNNYQ